MANIDFNKKHLTPHRRKMIETFVDCTRKIITDDGIKGVTIKKISDTTELNTATIYNYFENIEHLMFFSIMDAMDDYLRDLSNYVKEGDDPLYVYKQVWRVFSKHAFLKPNEYIEIFFSDIAREKGYYVYQYYKIFPFENDGYPAYLDKMLAASSLVERLKIQIEVCINVGYFDKETAEKCNWMLYYIFEGMLRRVQHKDLDAAKASEEFEDYLDIIVNTLKLK